jgi:hypothetical protein
MNVASSNLVTRSNKIMHLSLNFVAKFVKPPKRFTIALYNFYKKIR